ncbi:MAG: DUF1592 domain-containing protein [Pirellulales bacterium]
MHHLRHASARVSVGSSTADVFQLAAAFRRNTAAALRIGVASAAMIGLGSFTVVTRARADENSADNAPVATKPTLEQLKVDGRRRSRLLAEQTTNHEGSLPNATAAPTWPEPKLAEFRSQIEPILRSACVECHGPDNQEGNMRIDALDPNLHNGKDIDWWTDVFAVISKGEMPPPDSKQLNDAERAQIVDWLSGELHSASIVRRQSASHSVFRRMTRYEFNYALQDLLGLSWDFAKDLPPEAKSSEGFRNTAEQLRMSVSQLETFHRSARQALRRATVHGSQPQRLAWSITAKDISRHEWPKQAKQIEKLKEEHKNDEAKLKAELEKLEQSFTQPRAQTYFRNTSTGQTVPAAWDYGEAKYAIAPVEQRSAPPTAVEELAIIPAGRWLNVELGNRLPDEGTLRVRVRACRTSNDGGQNPSLQLFFGWQASNEGRALLRVSREDIAITAPPGAAEFYQWDIPLGEIYPRNSVRRTSPMGSMPSPSEYIRLANSSASPGDIQIDYVEVEAPVYDEWPPASHKQIFFADSQTQDESAYAREVIGNFMRRAWRREITTAELENKHQLFQRLRASSDSVEEAVVETLATVLSSPQFLYLVQATDEQTAGGKGSARQPLNGYELATRLSMFLWCSLPDDQLLDLAGSGRLLEPPVLEQQVQRMLDDPRSQRLAQQFVHQWLDLELLDFLNFQTHQPGFDPLLKEAMQQEPVAVFEEMLRRNESVLNFIHSDYTMANERLARHYGINGVHGNQFQRVPLNSDFRRGGLLTQAGVLAMNSDYPDSHPLKRGKWILVSLLNDPPPPPPPAVPQIDRTNPEIAKMTLKERIEDHRKQPACYNCHMKIDPWGIAFENYDALGKWRDKIGEKPVDASSDLPNHVKLEGMDGLKRILLADRQDQFVSAMVHKLSTFALGRTMKFADRADLDEIAGKVRRDGDGLKSMVSAVATSELFRTK